MKKWLLIISATVICVAAAFLYFFSLTPKGDTITSRESILNTAISKGNEWTIAKELELGGYIVSGAYSTDNKSTLAIFEPTGNGDYKFSTSTNRNSDEIIVGGVAINGEWYDLIWFNGAKTEYAEITYTINGQEVKAIKVDNKVLKALNTTDDPFYYYNSAKEKKMVRLGDYILTPMTFSSIDSASSSYFNNNFTKNNSHKCSTYSRYPNRKNYFTRILRTK